MDILSIALTLFLIMDPFGNIPVFMPILEKVPTERRRWVLVRELLLALAVIVSFIFGGRYVLSLLGLRPESISIAGGIILFLIAVRMVFPTREGVGEVEIEGEPLLVPLAVPLIAGPSLLAVLLLLTIAEPRETFAILVAAALAWLATFVVLLGSTLLMRLLTKRGLIAIERLMGMILAALAIQLLMDGVSNYLE
ncbi:MAG: NAAT family transporter [Burkholderiales bacterium]|nr:NAAT family transporter [Burkholderiales bacterium]